MPVFTSSIEVTADYPTIKPSLNLNFARSRSLDPRITFARASVGTYVGRDGLIKTAGEDEARFDHDPVTLESLGLLLEESRTNQLGTHNGTYVGNFRQTSQGLNTIGPDGVTNSAREFTINSDGGTGGSTLITANTNLGVNGTTKSWSCFLKVTRSNSIAFQFYDNNNNLTSDVYTLYADGSDPLYNSAGNAGSVRVDKYSNNWYRFRWEGFVGSTNNTSYLQIYSQSHISSDGSNVGYAIWGQSFETGTFCTSPILTTGSSVTRAVDNAEIKYDGWYDNSSSVKPSTFVGKFQTYDLGATRMVAEGSDGSTLKDFSMNTLTNSSELQFVHRYTANDSYDSTIGAGITINTPTTFAFSYDGTGGDITGSANSSTPNVGTDDLGTTSQAGGDRMRIGSRGNNSLYPNGTISELRYYKFKASSDQLLLLQ